MKAARLLLLLLFLTVSAAGCGPEAACGGNPPPEHPPDVLFIVMDTTSAERCSVTGYGLPTTPNLERIARRGLNFRNAWSPSGWTAPAHASMFTGLRVENHGLRHGNRSYLWADSVTLAEHLENAGYQAACFTNNANICPEQGLVQGFEKYVPLFAREDLPYPTAIPTHEEALKWLDEERRPDAPFFLFINHMEPHTFYEPPRSYADRFVGPEVSERALAAALEVTPDRSLQHNLGTVLLPEFTMSVLPVLYDAEIACLDHEIGKFFAQLQSRGLLDNALVIIAGDHGENLGRHGLVDHKFSLHRPILHVPLVVCLPGGERAGEVHDEVVRLEDVFPTVLEVCGLPLPPRLDGESLLGDLHGRIARALRDYPEEYMEHMAKVMGTREGYERVHADITSEFDGRYHRIDYSDGRRLVFDVLNDPEELHPLDH